MKNTEKIEKLQAELHDLLEAQESMVTLDEDGMTGWDFAELRDAIANFIQEREREAIEGFVKFCSSNQKKRVESQAEFLGEFAKKWIELIFISYLAEMEVKR